MNNNLAKKNKKAKSRSRFISTLKIISYLIIGLLLFLSNYIMYLYHFKISFNKNFLEETIISNLTQMDNVINDSIVNILDTRGIQNKTALNNEYNIIESDIDFKFSLNKIKVNLNVVIRSSSSKYDKYYNIEFTNQKIIDLDLMSLIDNPEKEVDKIFENLKKVFKNVIQETVCKLLLHNISYLGFEVGNTLEKIEKKIGCNKVKYIANSFKQELLSDGISEIEMNTIEKQMKVLINCIQEKLLEIISEPFQTTKTIEQIIDDNKDAKNEDELNPELIGYIIDNDSQTEINTILENSKYDKYEEYKLLLKQFITHYNELKTTICDNLNDKLEQIDFSDLDSKIETLKQDIDLDNKIKEADTYLKNYRIIFIVLFSLYGLFILISVLYLIFPRKSIYLMDKDFLFGVFLYYPYLFLSLILLLFNLAISSSLIYYNNKNILKESGTNLNEIDKILFKIDKGGYMFISGTILFLLLKIYLFFRIFY